ncbi:hypothetical protein CCACVL1_25844 [Corchorus capsularis]|uniref:Uncharacterized protein n=1 Tax=Corchorus capsularis TaxID=210143 RepID=A0A1R3GGT8_COCAP|nr:hypothetical protein CCACVL1_25844 [Corchorus capsularis]
MKNYIETIRLRQVLLEVCTSHYDAIISAVLNRRLIAG